MAHSIEMISIDDQIPLLPQTENDELEEGRKVDHLIEVKNTNNGQAPSGSQTEKSVNQIYAEKFEDLDNSPIELCTIFRVNVCLRESNEDAYTPKMVSIGPYHKKNPQLDAMEKYKLKYLQLDAMEKYKLLYLRRFLQRKEGLNVESCIKELEKLKEEAIKCYEDIEGDGQFCQMLLLDGCFVIEFIRDCCQMLPEREGRIIDDGSYIYRDLMLLENQLPFFVLNKLQHLTMQDSELPLAILVSKSFPFFVDLPKITLESFGEIARYNIKHLLHLVHILSCHGNPTKKPNNDDKSWYILMPNATELSEAGVCFAKDSVTKSLFDIIKFENGLMTIPSFRVEDDTEIILRNLIAYEQQSHNIYHTYFSDFATFMDKLIESDKDVNLLRQKGIIENFLGEDKQVANMFNKIGNGIVTSSFSFYYMEQCRNAVEHCEKPRNRMKANLMHNYFSSPWVGASTIAAIILLILTTIQTILAFTGSVKSNK